MLYAVAWDPISHHRSSRAQPTYTSYTRTLPQLHRLYSQGWLWRRCQCVVDSSSFSSLLTTPYLRDCYHTKSLLPSSSFPIPSSVTSFRASSPHMALPSAQGAPSFRQLLFPGVAEGPNDRASLHDPALHRSRPYRRPSRRGPFGATVASVFQTVRGGDLVAYSEIKITGSEIGYYQVATLYFMMCRCLPFIEGL